jgi:hypothetical protein
MKYSLTEWENPKVVQLTQDNMVILKPSGIPIDELCST